MEQVESIQRSGFKGHRLPSSIHRREACTRTHATRTSQRRHEDHYRLFRAFSRLHRYKDPKMGPSQVLFAGQQRGWFFYEIRR